MSTKQDLDVGDYWMLLYGRRWVIGLMIVLSGLFSAYLSNSIAPIYEARTEFYVPQDAVIAAGGPDRGTMRVPGLKEHAKAYVALLEKEDAARWVANAVPERTLDEIVTRSDFDVAPGAAILVYVRDRDPEIARKLTVAFRDYFQQFHTLTIRSSLEHSIERSRSRLQELEQEKKALQQSRSDYMREQNIASIAVLLNELETQSARTQQQLRSTQVEFEEVKQRVQSLRSAIETQTAAHGAGQLPTRVFDQILGALHRDLDVALVRQDAVRTRQQALRSSMSEVRITIQALPEKQRTLLQFQTEIALKDNAVADLTGLLEGLGGQLRLLKQNIVILAEARAPASPVFPIVWLNVAVAMLGGAVIGILYALLLDYIDRRRRQRRYRALAEDDWLRDAIDDIASRRTAL